MGNWWTDNLLVAPHCEHHHDVEAADGKHKVEERVAVNYFTNFIVVHWLTTMKVLTMLICTMQIKMLQIN